MPAGHLAQSAAALRTDPAVESRANGTGFTVAPMITFRVGVSGGSHFHELAACQRSLIFRKRAPGTANEEDRQSRARDRANNSKLHARPIISGSGKRMNKYYPEFRSGCAKVESGIKTRVMLAALDFAFGAWLVDRLGGL